MRRIKNNLRAVAAAFLVCICWPSAAQTTGTFRFRNLSIENGLSQSDVTDIIQDGTGFMWFATNNGLNRYDGIQIVTYKSLGTGGDGLSGNIVFCLERDSLGNFWVGTRNGIDYYDRDVESLTSYHVLIMPSGAKLPILRARALLQGADGTLWAGISNNLCRFDSKAGCFRALDLGPAFPYKGKGVNNINALAEDFHGRLLIGTDNGLYVYGKDGRLSKIIPNKTNCILKDPSSGRIIAGADRGLYLIGRNNKVRGEITYRDKRLRNVSALYRDSFNRLWAGTKTDGLYIVEGDQIINVRKNPKDVHSLPSNDILSLWEDRSGMMWVGTSTGGVSIHTLAANPFTNLTKDPFSLETSLSDRVVQGIYAENDSLIWIGTKEGFLNRYDGSARRMEHYFLGRDIHSNYAHRISAIAPRNDTELWIGTERGLAVFNKKTKKFSQFSGDNALANTYVSVLYPDRDGSLLCGTGNGLFVIRNGNIENFPLGEDSTLRRNSIRTIYRDRSSGTLWLGFRDRGLGRIVARGDELRLETFVNDPENPESISLNDVSAVFEDSRQQLWAGTWGGGLNLLTDRERMTFKRYNEQDGLSDNVIFSIHEGRENELWLSTYNGLTSFDTRNGIFNIYTFYDGIQSNEFSVGAHFQTPDGLLLFGGINGVTLFRPQQLSRQVSPAEMAFTNLSIYNRELKVGEEFRGVRILDRAISRTERITLPYNVRQFSLGVALFAYDLPHKNCFKYKLEGFDHEWNYMDDRTNISYSNLKPGLYRLEVNGRTSTGEWQSEPLVLTIRIKAPLWASPPGYIFYVLLASTLVWLLANRLRRKARAKRERFHRQVREESQREIDEAKMLFYTNISHELRTPLMLIVGLADKIDTMLGADSPVQRQVAVMKRNSDMLLRLINELLDFKKIESGNLTVELSRVEIVNFVRGIVSYFEEACTNKGIRILLQSEVPAYEMLCDRNKSEKILFNLLSNAVKYTTDEICVSIMVSECVNDEGYVVISVSDNGPGIPHEDQSRIFERFYQVEKSGVQQTGSGIGLHIASEMARMLGGKLDVESTEGTGTAFYLHLPAREGVQIGDATERGEDAVGKTGVLVIDDNDDLRYYLREALSDEYEIWEARNGQEGINAARNMMPDIIVCDIMMPDMNGLGLCERLKADAETSHIPIILASALSTDTTRIEGLSKGADAYLVKPFSGEHLRAQIRAILSNREALREKLRMELSMSLKGIELSSPYDKLLVKAVEFIEKHLDDPDYDVEELSRDVGLSRMHLHRKMKSMIGQSPGEFIRSFRLTRAAELILQDKITVNEVGYMVGFRNPKHFRESFRKKYGMSPSDYLKTNKSQKEDHE